MPPRVSLHSTPMFTALLLTLGPSARRGSSEVMAAGVFAFGCVPLGGRMAHGRARRDDPRSRARRSCGITHPKLAECLVPDFRDLTLVEAQLAGFDGCLYCAGISSSGLTE